MANQTTIALLGTISTMIVESFTAKAKADSLGGKLAVRMAELFALCTTDAEFEEVFGNGINGKEHKPGMLREQVDLTIAKMAKPKQEGVRNMLRVRMSEARKLRRLGGFPAKDENLQAALKRYQKAAPRAARPEGNAKDGFVIPAELTHEQLAEALSHWLTEQTPAKAKALAADLKDMFAPPAKKVRKAA